MFPKKFSYIWSFLPLRAEFLRRTDTQTHVRAKFSWIGTKFRFWNANCQNTDFFKFLVQIDDYFLDLKKYIFFFMAILVHNSVQNI